MHVISRVHVHMRLYIDIAHIYQACDRAIPISMTRKFNFHEIKQYLKTYLTNLY